MSTNLNKWLELLDGKSLPMFQQTADAFRDAGSGLDATHDALKRQLYFDPGASLHLLRLTNNSSKRRLSSPVNSAYDSVMLLGMQRLHSIPDEVEKLEIPATTLMLRGYVSVAMRSYFSASLAYESATLLGEPEPMKIFTASLLHAMGEMYLWIYGEDEMQRIHTLMYEEDMPADEAQYIVLGFSLEQLSYALCERWNMSPLLCASLGAEENDSVQVLQVKMAAQVGRLSEQGWYHLGMDQCLENMAARLHFPYEETVARIHQMAITVARETEKFGMVTAAAFLPMLPGTIKNEFVIESLMSQSVVEEDKQHLCLIPQPDVYTETLEQLKRYVSERASVHDVVMRVMEGLHDGIGLNRVIFSMLNQDRTELKARFHMGLDNDPIFSLFSFNVEQSHLFSTLLNKKMSVWLGDHNREKLWKHVPVQVRKQIGTDSFYAMSVFVKDKSIGMFYADRHTLDCQLDEQSYTRFKEICSLAAKGIAVAYGK
jgi:HD-like signal output (HDOD) protein